MAKPTKEQKARRRAVKTTRAAAKDKRRKQKELTKMEFDGMRHIEQRPQHEDFSQAAARVVREATERS